LYIGKQTLAHKHQFSECYAKGKTSGISEQ